MHPMLPAKFPCTKAFQRQLHFRQLHNILKTFPARICNTKKQILENKVKKILENKVFITTGYGYNCERTNLE